MNILQKIIATVDGWQQKHRAVGFPYAVIKKFGDNNGGYQAALITYYAFWSLFPLLLVLVTVLQLWFHGNPHLQKQVITDVSHYFPLLGTQLQSSVHGIGGRTGLGLVVGIVLTLYGARGVADALRFTLNNIWQVPKNARSGFPKNLLQSLAIMATAGFGFVITVAISSFTAGLGHSLIVRSALNIIGMAVTTGVLILVFRIATSHRVPIRDMAVGATIAAVITQLLLTFGSLLVAHELKNLDSLYGTFAIVLGLLFWLYILAQVVVYSAEIDSVRHLKLWPRGIDGSRPTAADQRAYETYAKTERYGHVQHISVSFKSK